MTNEEVVEELNADLKEVNFWLERYKSNGEVCEKREIRKVVLEAAIKALEDKGYEQGYKDGYAKGYEEGYDRGYITGEAQADAWLVIEEHINDTLDKIRAEIVDLGQRTMNDNRASGIWACRDIIDKYKAERSDKG